jgi:hypothetical protein
MGKSAEPDVKTDSKATNTTETVNRATDAIRNASKASPTSRSLGHVGSLANHVDSANAQQTSPSFDLAAAISEPPLREVPNAEYGRLLGIRLPENSHEAWLVLPERKGTRSVRLKENNREFLGRIIPWMQQCIDAGQITFNQDKSPIHQTRYGLFIASPDFFTGMDMVMAKKWRDYIKRCEFSYRVNGLTMIKMQVKGSGKVINGFLLNYHELTYKGSKLPHNEVLDLAPLERQTTN